MNTDNQRILSPYKMCSLIHVKAADLQEMTDKRLVAEEGSTVKNRAIIINLQSSNKARMYFPLKKAR